MITSSPCGRSSTADVAAASRLFRSPISPWRTWTLSIFSSTRASLVLATSRTRPITVFVEPLLRNCSQASYGEVVITKYSLVIGTGKLTPRPLEAPTMTYEGMLIFDVGEFLTLDRSLERSLKNVDVDGLMYKAQGVDVDGKFNVKRGTRSFIQKEHHIHSCHY